MYVNSEMLLLRENRNDLRSRVFDKPRGNEIQRTRGEMVLVGRGESLPSLWKKEDLGADAPSCQVLWWEDK